MIKDNKILIGAGEENVYLYPSMANRHGVICGATGTGKTYTLKVLAEGFSELGVPVFLADIKGDVSSLSLSGVKDEKTVSRLEKIGIDPADYEAKSYPCRFWDVYGKGGIPVRATISDVGPMLLSRLMNLSDVQSGVLNIAFHVADDNGWELIDLKDLRAMLTYVADHRSELVTSYGNVSSQSVGAIQRALLELQDQGADAFFGEPALNIADWMTQDENGQGMINILHCVELSQQPLMYATVMLWMLSELYEVMPECGDLEKPRIVFFFDEAHMLFHDAPKALLDKIVQVVKLVRSKGVGVYFITQSPSDIPNTVLAQLNNRIQHAMNAYTPAELKAVKTAAESFRPNPAFKTEDAILNLGIGVALVSTLGEDGAPQIVQQATICPPQSGNKALNTAARAMIVASDPLYENYKTAVDNESAYEILNGIHPGQDEEPLQPPVLEEEAVAEEAVEEVPETAAVAAEEETDEQQAIADALAAEKARKKEEREKQALYKAQGLDKYGRTKLQASVEKAAKSTARTFGRNVGKKITRTVLGTKNKTLSKYAGQAVGSLISDLIGGVMR